jgi:hypothetical protein
MQATVGDMLTQVDYLSHVQRMIETNPKASKWQLAMDWEKVKQRKIYMVWR